MRRPGLIAVVAAVAGLTWPAPAASAAPQQVVIAGYNYVASGTTHYGLGLSMLDVGPIVVRGDTITFTNLDGIGHDVQECEGCSPFSTARKKDGGFGSPGLLGIGESFTIDTASLPRNGTFQYFCTPHNYMRGSFTVVNPNDPIY